MMPSGSIPTTVSRLFFAFPAAFVTVPPMSKVDLGDGMRIETTFKKNGNATIYVRHKDIIISTHPLISSARNTFEGRIVQISDLGSVVKLSVDAGKKFVVQITRRSLIEIGLNISSKVFLTFKASSVELI